MDMKVEMNLKQLLKRHGIAQQAFCEGVSLSRGAVYRLLDFDLLPGRDATLPGRIAEFLTQRGVEPSSFEPLLETLLSHPKGTSCGAQQKKAPNVRQHAGADPEASTEETQEESMLLRNETLTPQARQHFGLVRSPFVDDVRTRADVFASANTRYVRAALLDAALNHGFIGIVGESGAGKSTLLEELEERIADEGRQVMIIRPYVLAMEENDQKGRTLKSGQIAEAIIAALDPAGKPKNTPEARFKQVHDLLKASRSAGYSHLLAIEEAHCLPVATLKHLKRFLELKQGLGRLLGICLVGQPELKNRLSDRNPEVREVVQRCELVELQPLDNDLEAYLKHKFERMEIKLDDVLAPDACDALRARLISLPRGGKPSDARSLCYPLVVNNLVTRG